MPYHETYAFDVRARGPYAIVRAIGELDLAAVDDLHRAVRRAARRAPRVIVDLRPVTFMDTFLLRALVALHQEALTAQDWSLHVIAGSGGCVQRLLDLAGARGELRWISPEQLAG